MPQVPASFADAHRGDDALLQIGAVGQRVDQRGGGGRRAGADDERKLAEFGDVLVGDDLAGAIDQHEFGLVLPDGERTALLQDDDDGAGQPALDGGVLHPGQGSHALARHLDRETQDRIAYAHAKCRAQQRFRRIGATLDHHVGDAQSGESRDAAEAFPQRRQCAARCSRVQDGHAEQRR